MSRRAADDAPMGQPEYKRSRTGGSGGGGGGGNKSGPSGALDIAAIRAQIAARKAEAEARLAKTTPRPAGPAAPPQAQASTTTTAASSSTASATAGPSGGGGAGGGGGQSLADRVAAAKARIDALNKGAGGAPILPSSAGLHPLLMGDSTGTGSGTGARGGAGDKLDKKALKDRYKTMAPKFSTVRANQASVDAAAAAAPATLQSQSQAQGAMGVPSLNPYLSTSTSGPGQTSASASALAPGSEDAGGSGAAGGWAGGVGAGVVKERKSRQFQFAQPGRFVRQGDQLRSEAKLEALKQRIAEASKKAGLEGEFDVLEKSLKRQPPPEVEWWDQALLPEGKTYADLDGTMAFLEGSDDSLITHLVQHPIPIPAPGDKKQPERAMMLTKKEQKKMRRQRRMAELEDKRDRQKMGLLPPDPPKVRLANLMKVLTSDAVQDPTKVEAKVRREVAARATKHEQDNSDRKLTAEERKEKEYQQMLARERRGVHGAVFKIRYLTNGQHKFKVRETAKRDLLSGVCVFAPDFALVVVEGVEKNIKHYKKLLLARIDWTEQARPLDRAKDEDGDGEDGADEDDEVKGDLADNKCELIWEGEVPERTFKGFRARHAESDTRAKEWLEGRWVGMWDLAKRWVWQGEDL